MGVNIFEGQKFLGVNNILGLKVFGGQKCLGFKNIRGSKIVGGQQNSRALQAEHIGHY